MFKETVFLYQLSQEISGKISLPNVGIEEVDLDIVFDLSAKNNMLYFHCKKILESFGRDLKAERLAYINSVIIKAEAESEKIKKTIAFLNETLNDFILMKTYRGYPRIPNDLDIIVRDYGIVLELLKTKGFVQENDDKVQKDSQLEKDGFYRVHLHDNLHWADSEFFDKDFVFLEPRRIDFAGTKVNIPDYGADFLMHIAHINFEPLHITLSDLLYLFSIASKVNWEACLSQAGKYRWKRAFIDTVAIMDAIHHRLYPGVCPFDSFKFTHKQVNSDNDLIMPRTLPRGHLLNTMFEKGLFLYALSKFSKSLKVITRGDSYSGYYEDAEKRNLKNA